MGSVSLAWSPCYTPLTQVSWSLWLYISHANGMREGLCFNDKKIYIVLVREVREEHL